MTISEKTLLQSPGQVIITLDPQENSVAKQGKANMEARFVQTDRVLSAFLDNIMFCPPKDA
jgi:hypothetical protein